MACLENNPCSPCNECTSCGEDIYDNCGCLNPTTWECISKPGVLAPLGVTNDMNGIQVLQAISDTINALAPSTPIPGNDVYAKVSSTDNTSDYLDNKLLAGTYLTKTVLNPGVNEKIRFNVNPSSLISVDSGNTLDLGTDGKFRVVQTAPVVDLAIVGGTGVTVTGTGPVVDPYIISINPSISATKPCFDGVWRNLDLNVNTGNPGVTLNAQSVQYRVRFDGTVELKGSATYTVAFGSYADITRKRTITAGSMSSMGTLSSGCGLSSIEMAGTADLKSIMYIDQPGTGDQITQQYGYIIRKIGYNLILEFQSAYILATSKTIVINFEGCTIHPTL